MFKFLNETQMAIWCYELSFRNQLTFRPAMDFYDREGAAVVYADDNGVLFRWDGSPVAFIYRDAIYTFAGNFIGWILNGWIRDNAGNAMLFSDDTQGVGPAKPMKKLKSLKGFKRFAPLKGLRELPPMKALPTFDWSNKRFW